MNLSPMLMDLTTRPLRFSEAFRAMFDLEWRVAHKPECG